LKKKRLLSSIIKEMMKYSSLGQKELDSGVVLYGKAPHVGKHAYLHAVYPALSLIDIDLIQQRIGRELPNCLVELYQESNGLNYFIDTFAIYGLRTNLGRSIDSAYQPYDALTPNIDERISDASEDMVFFAFYDWDGSMLYARQADERIYFCGPDSVQPKKIWSSMFEMLTQEANRISSLFDLKGREIDESKSTLPA
jgi:hypothetical protein